mgnify:CR=1 FL=1|tara:strand:- start:1268 stop:2365 length:1098 start_codon:yes stop_codon:yes gene_type:complete
MGHKTVKLSASRIKTAAECSWKYYAKYSLKLPDPTNDGASRGTVCHAILEVLSREDRQSYFDKICATGDIFSVPAVGKLAMTLAKRLEVDDKDNLELINFMTVNGLEHDYFGADPISPSQAFSEKLFDIRVDDGGKRYHINGFIDKLFLYEGNKAALIRDFKTSKKVFSGKEVTDNLQDLMYSLAVKHLYPEYSFRQSEFLFLKFELGKDLLGDWNEGVLRMEPLSDEELEGFEYQLTEWQEYLENFDEDAAHSDFAADKSFPKDKSFGGPLCCGNRGKTGYPGQLKKDGTPMWHCSFKFPFSYYVLKDSSGKRKNFPNGRPMTVLEDDLDSLKMLQEEGDVIERLEYEGCPRHHLIEDDDEFSL